MSAHRLQAHDGADEEDQEQRPSDRGPLVAPEEAPHDGEGRADADPHRVGGAGGQRDHRPGQAGQLSLLLRAKYLVDVIGYNEVRGLPLKATQLAHVIADLVGQAEDVTVELGIWGQPSQKEHI
jgi:hypothetical protein